MWNKAISICINLLSVVQFIYINAHLVHSVLRLMLICTVYKWSFSCQKSRSSFMKAGVASNQNGLKPQMKHAISSVIPADSIVIVLVWWCWIIDDLMTLCASFGPAFAVYPQLPASFQAVCVTLHPIYVQLVLILHLLFLYAIVTKTKVLSR